MASNTGPGARTKGSIFVYDELPPQIRQKLANANHNWSPEETLDALNWEGAAFVREAIDASEKAEADRHYAILASGQPYPRETQ